MGRDGSRLHDRVVGVVVFAIVFATAALIVESSRNRGGRNRLLGDFGFQRDRGIGRRRAAARSDDEINSDGNAAGKGEEDIADRTTEIRTGAIDSESEASAPRKKNCTSCIVIIVERHSGICDVVRKFKEFENVVTRLNTVVRQRMGNRRLDFKYMVAKKKNAMEQLNETFERFVRGIETFEKFIGATDKNFESIAPTVSSIDDSATEADHPNSHSDDANPLDLVAKSFPDLLVHHHEGRIAQNPLKTCAMNMMKYGFDVCEILKIMDKLNEFIESEIGGRVDQPTIGISEIPMKIGSQDFSLPTVLRAVVRSLFDDSGIFMPDNGAPDNMWRGFGSREGLNSHGRRNLMNENKEEIAEIFETSDFRIEFISENEFPEFDGSTIYRRGNYLNERKLEELSRRATPRPGQEGTLQQAGRWGSIVFWG